MRIDHRWMRLVALATVGLVAVAGSSSWPQESAYDVVIRGGRVLDGSGNPWIRADVGIREGRFAAVGRVAGRGAVEIDATGMFVSPGWIDMMDHSGEVLRHNGRAENKLRMGVTSAIGGEGGTPVPADELEGYFRELEEEGISLNFGTYFSATQARVAAMGSGAGEPTSEQLAEMRQVVEVAMRAGALGITTALIYPPSSFHSTAELIELARVAERYGGLYASHIRGEGKELVESVREAIEIGERSGAPVEIFHLKAAYEPGWGLLMREAGLAIERARRRGVDVAADLYPYTAGGTGLEATVPSWVFDQGIEVARQRLSDPAVRARLREELRTGSPGWWNIVEASGGWDRIVLVNAGNEAHQHFEQRTIADIARQLGKHPADAAWDLVLAGEERVLAIYHMMSEEDIRTALRFPWTSIGSDAGAAAEPGAEDGLGLPHPRSYGTFPRIIARYVRELGVLRLEEAIRKMTAWPATRMRLTDRGVIREGAWADVVVFDFERIRDLATWESPTRFPEGIEWVLVNGEVVIERGSHTGARPGRVLYGPGRRE